MRWVELRWIGMSRVELCLVGLIQVRLSLVGKGWVELSWVELGYIELSWVLLSWVELCWVRLSWGELSSVELGWAELSLAELNWVELSSVELSWVEWSRVEMSKYIEIWNIDGALKCKKLHIRDKISYKVHYLSSSQQWLQQNHIDCPSFYATLKGKESFKGMSIDLWWHTPNEELSKCIENMKYRWRWLIFKNIYYIYN